jgi:hypothetical protein
MIAFANKNQNLTIVLGSLVYEFPTKSADQAHLIAARSADDPLVRDLLQMACRATPKVANRHELEARDDDRMRLDTGPYANIRQTVRQIKEAA